MRTDPVTVPRGPEARIAASETAKAGASESNGPVPVPPASAGHLILQLWSSLSWHRTGQAALLILVMSAAVTGILWGIGHALQSFAAHFEAWTAISAVAAVTGTRALTTSAPRRRDPPRRDH